MHSLFADNIYKNKVTELNLWNLIYNNFALKRIEIRNVLSINVINIFQQV